MKVCDKCGIEYPDTENFCTECGNKLIGEVPEIERPPLDVEGMNKKLVELEDGLNELGSRISEMKSVKIPEGIEGLPAIQDDLKAMGDDLHKVGSDLKELTERLKDNEVNVEGLQNIVVNLAKKGDIDGLKDVLEESQKKKFSEMRSRINRSIKDYISSMETSTQELGKKIGSKLKEIEKMKGALREEAAKEIAAGVARETQKLGRLSTKLNEHEKVLGELRGLGEKLSSEQKRRLKASEAAMSKALKDFEGKSSKLTSRLDDRISKLSSELDAKSLKSYAELDSRVSDISSALEASTSTLSGIEDKLGKSVLANSRKIAQLNRSISALRKFETKTRADLKIFSDVEESIGILGILSQDLEKKVSAGLSEIESMEKQLTKSERQMKAGIRKELDKQGKTLAEAQDKKMGSLRTGLIKPVTEMKERVAGMEKALEELAALRKQIAAVRAEPKAKPADIKELSTRISDIEKLAKHPKPTGFPKLQKDVARLGTLTKVLSGDVKALKDSATEKRVKSLETSIIARLADLDDRTSRAASKLRSELEADIKKSLRGTARKEALRMSEARSELKREAEKLSDMVDSRMRTEAEKSARASAEEFRLKLREFDEFRTDFSKRLGMMKDFIDALDRRSGREVAAIDARLKDVLKTQERMELEGITSTGPVKPGASRAEMQKMAREMETHIKKEVHKMIKESSVQSLRAIRELESRLRGFGAPAAMGGISREELAALKREIVKRVLDELGRSLIH